MPDRKDQERRELAAGETSEVACEVIDHALKKLTGSDMDAGNQLSALATLRDEIEEWIFCAVYEAQAKNLPWAEIASCLGVPEREARQILYPDWDEPDF